MEYKEAKEFAQQLLDGEFAEVNDNPTNYCLAMGWTKNSKGTKKAIKKKFSLVPDAEDFEKLTAIILDADTEEYHIIAESNAVCDFLCNCVAGHILK